MNTIDKILLSCAIFLVLFTVCMIVIFCIYQSVPDTLVDAVFGLMGSEVFITFAIWWIKKKGQKKNGHQDETNK